jgi:anti-sigma factor RsiW
VNVDDLACRELVEGITDLLDGRLSPVEQAAVRAHLEECPGCAAAIDQFQRTIEVLGRLAERDVRELDPAVADALLEAFRRRPG